MKDALRKETQFWLVTPKASLAGVSGLDALVGGNYIGMMPGKGEPEDHFVAPRHPTQIPHQQRRANDPPAGAGSWLSEQRLAGLLPENPGRAGV